MAPILDFFYQLLSAFSVKKNRVKMERTKKIHSKNALEKFKINLIKISKLFN